MKKTSLTVILLTLLSFASFAQTNVSGGIYANTTWTLANSPYIVVDTVVVFPGVTLTIEPGVVVKFDDNKYLEIRQASLIAEGTVTDSITFTSNSLTPSPGIWDRIHWYGGTTASESSRFNYCNVLYSKFGIYAGPAQDTVRIKNSKFYYNVSGILSSGRSWIDSCDFQYNTGKGIGTAVLSRIYNCNFSHNQTGLDIGSYDSLRYCTIDSNQTGIIFGNGKMIDCFIRYNQNGLISGGGDNIQNCIIDSNIVAGVKTYSSDNIINCEINNNGIGLDNYGSNQITMNVIEYNSTGIKNNASNSNIYCNKICYSTSYDLYYNVTFNNTTITNNYWCTPDSLSTALVIYDGYDDASLGLVSFMPLDTSNCYLTGCLLNVTASVTNATCDTCHNGSATAHVANGFAPYSYTWYTSPIQYTQTATALTSGTYSVCVTDGHGCTACNNNVFVDSSNCTGFAVYATATNASCSLCNDGTGIAHVVAGTAPYIYTWYTVPIQTTDTATGLTTGNYAVCVTDLYGCIACDTVTVSIGSCSAYYTIYADTAPHTYDLVNMASGTPPLTYNWNWGDGSPDDTAAYPSHTYATSGTYTICLSITDSAGCTSSYCNGFYLLSPLSSNAVHVNVIPPVSTGIHVNTDAKLFFISPNPASDYLTLHFAGNTPQSQIRIINLLGEVKYYSSATGVETNLNISSLAGGIYFVEVAQGNKVSRERFVKQ